MGPDLDEALLGELEQLDHRGLPEVVDDLRLGDVAADLIELADRIEPPLRLRSPRRC